jgi:hypothetical protein
LLAGPFLFLVSAPLCLPPFIPGVEKREREREELQVGEMDLLERNIKTETEETRKEQERKEEEEVEAGERKTQEPPQQGQGLSLSLANGSGRYLASPLRDSPHRTAESSEGSASLEWFAAV